MKISGNVKRYINYFSQSTRYHLFWALSCLFLFGLLGIFPLGKLAVQKIRTIGEVNKIISDLRTKGSDFDALKSSYQEIQPYIYFLDTYMPQEIGLEDYLVSLNSATSRRGFSINRLIPLDDKEPNKLIIRVDITGFGDVVSLIRDIEDLKRVTKITKIEVTKIKGRDKVELEIQIYSRG